MDIQAERVNQSAHRLAKASFVFGILSIISLVGALIWNLQYGGGGLGMFCGLLLGLLSPIVGVMALRKMKENKKGKIFAVIGIVLGTPVFLSALSLLIWVLFLAG